MTSHSGRFWRSALALAALATTALPGRADACGGFFCSLSSPVEQAGERILFAVSGTNVTAHIQIQYQGPSEKFSWVLPLPSVPTLGVGSDLMFDALRAQTDPQFQLEWKNDEGCNFQGGMCPMEAAGGFDNGGPPPPSPADVNVLAEGDVGPFNYKVVESSSGDALFTWLNENGYDQPEESKGIIGHYVNQKFVFLALRLLKDKDAGDLQPVVVNYTAPTLACVPLKLTSIAALANMPVWTWILAKARAVPMNFFHVLLNAKAYDWLNCAGNQYYFGGPGGFGGFYPGGVDCQKAYLDLVTKAVDEAAGHAFVTEFAGSSAVMAEKIYKEGMFDLAKLAKIATPGEFLQEMLNQNFPRNAFFQQVIKDNIPKPDDAKLPEDCKGDQAFYSTFNLDKCAGFIEGWTFDPQKMADDLEERVVKPLKDAQGLFDHHPYLTRVFTTISPEEMTKDPVFSFNPDLADVSNLHKVTAKAHCKPGSTYDADAVTLMFDDGDEITVQGDFQQCGGFIAQPGTGGTDAQPPVAEIQIMSESGQPTPVDKKDVVVQDAILDTKSPNPNQSDAVQTPEANTNPGNSGTFATPTVNPTTKTPAGDSGSSSDCAFGFGPASAAPVALLLGLLAGVAILRRRRS